MASFFQSYYVLGAEQVEAARGRIVKFMGDASLVVFTPESAQKVIAALQVLAVETRVLAGQFGLNTYLNINVHIGPILAGCFGPPGHERFDVIGKTVNVAARLGRRGLTLSSQAFRCLDSKFRKRFDIHMPPITYQASTSN